MTLKITLSLKTSLNARGLYPRPTIEGELGTIRAMRRKPPSISDIFETVNFGARHVNGVLRLGGVLHHGWMNGQEYRVLRGSFLDARRHRDLWPNAC